MRRLIRSIAWAVFALLWPAWAKGSAPAAPRDTSYFQATVCPGQTFFIAGTLFDLQNPSGTILLPGASWDGTDSVIVVALSPTPPSSQTFRQTLCGNQALFLHGQIFDPSNPTGSILFPNAAAGGCDSLLLVELTFLQPAFYLLQRTICSNDTVWVNGQAYDQYYYLGSETLAGGAYNGCDSTIVVDLTVLPAPVDTFRATICPNTTLTINGIPYGVNRPNGAEILANAAQNGCDSLVVVQLSFHEGLVPGFLGSDTTVVVGDEVCLEAPALDAAAQYVWQPAELCASPFCERVCAVFNRNETISLRVTDTNGCQYEDDLRVTVKNERPIYVPNVFAPGANEPNDRFFIHSRIAGARLTWVRIYDRWGSLVAEKTNLLPDAQTSIWDGSVNGRPVPPDVFIYAFEIEYPDQFKEVRSGSVTVVR